MHHTAASFITRDQLELEHDNEPGKGKKEKNNDTMI